MKMNLLVLCALGSLSLVACDKKEPSKNALAVAASTAFAGEPAAKLPVGTHAKCPVSGEDFVVKDSTVQVTYNGKNYAFCCPDCQPAFAKNPAKYAKN